MAYITSIHRSSVTDLLRAWVARLQEARARRAEFNRTVRELQMLSDRDLADLGISRFSIEDLAREHAFGK
jgi:uncharacterized protein YjiS (DUF1127 family)